MRIFLLVLILIFSLQLTKVVDVTKVGEIRDFEIEGISVGDSALDFFTENQIIKEKRNYYNYDNFIPAEFEYLDSFKIYDAVQITYKKGDTQYKIYGIAGFLDFPNNIKDCYKKKDEIIDEISGLFSNFKIKKFKEKHPGDPSGKSITTGATFDLNSGFIEIACNDWSKEIGYIDVLRVDIKTNEFEEWLTVAY